MPLFFSFFESQPFFRLVLEANDYENLHWNQEGKYCQLLMTKDHKNFIWIWTRCVSPVADPETQVPEQEIHEAASGGHLSITFLTVPGRGIYDLFAPWIRYIESFASVPFVTQMSFCSLIIYWHVFKFFTIQMIRMTIICENMLYLSGAT